MRIRSVTRDDAWLAAATSGWGLVLLERTGVAQIVVTAIAGVGVLILSRAPLPGAAVVGTASLSAWGLGVPQENAAVLLPMLLAAFALGRRLSAAPGLGGLGLLLATVLARELTLPNLLFGLLLLGGTWGFGRAVRTRATAARAAAEHADALHAADPAHLAVAVVALERERLADETVEVVREAVRQMRALADQASAGLDPAGIGAIQERGGRAVTELRRLLGLLRAEQGRPSPESREAPPARPHKGDVAVAVVAVGATLAEAVLLVPTSGAGLVLTTVLCGSLVLRRRHTSAAILLAAGAAALGLVTSTPLARGFGELLALGLLSWTAGGSDSRRAREAWGLLLLLTLVGVAQEGTGDLAMSAAVCVLPVVAGRAWGDRDRAATASDRDAASLRRQIDTRVGEAVTAERLRIARELHDVASHAVGVMVLQAGAAAALRERDPAAARAALAVVSTSGAEALAELAVLGDVLRAGAPTTGPVPVTGAGLRQALEDLCHRMRASGLQVSGTLTPRLPDDAEACTTIYRVAQEALTNAARHAPGSHVELVVGHDRTRLVIEVRDDGTGGDSAAPGFGLVGLAERVRGCGGQLRAGPGPQGGFVVEARIPVTTTTEVPEEVAR